MTHQIAHPAPTTEDLVKGLNGKQRQAVLLPRESALVLAGAGSGKTTVLIARIALLVNIGVMPKAILAVTFTNKASKEMTERLRSKLPAEATRSIWTGTFHSVCSRILRTEYEAAGLQKNFAILDTDAQKILIKQLTKDRNGASEGDEEEDDKLQAKDVVAWINSKKERGIRPDDIECVPGSEVEAKVQLYREYQDACRRQGLLDFSDLLYRTVELFERDAAIRQKYQSKFSAILVDEFQDTNTIQYAWLKLIKSPNSFVMAVGDDDQSIYAFRGANPSNMQRFVQEMTATASEPSGMIIKLDQNYRSLPYILNSANSLIARNTDRLGKDLWTQSTDAGEKIKITTFPNANSEAAEIAKMIHSLVIDDAVKPSEIAVLYRTNMQSRLLEQELNKMSIPVTVYGGQRFYDREEIRNLLAYLDLVASVDRDIAFARVVNVPARGIGLTTVEDLRQEAKSRQKSMMETIAIRADEGAHMARAGASRKQRVLEQFVGLVLTWCEGAKETSLSQLISQIIEQSGLRTMYEAQPKEEAADRLGNLEELVTAARQFEIDRPELVGAYEQLPEYLTMVQLMTSTSEASMDQKNTVSLMTVHSSKGLEFDNVFITGMEEGTFPHQRSLGDNNGKVALDAWANGGFDTYEYSDDGNLSDESAARLAAEREAYGEGLDTPEMQEERRLMYVAITRARKHLAISHAKIRMVGGESKSQEPSRFLLELPKQYVAKQMYGNGGDSKQVGQTGWDKALDDDTDSYVAKSPNWGKKRPRH